MKGGMSKRLAGAQQMRVERLGMQAVKGGVVLDVEMASRGLTWVGMGQMHVEKGRDASGEGC